jgi:hypothetical protein
MKPGALKLRVNWIHNVYSPTMGSSTAHLAVSLPQGNQPPPPARRAADRGVTVQVDQFESKGLKTVFHLLGSRVETRGSRVETRRFQAMWVN